MFHLVDEEHVTCWFHHCPPGGGPIAPDPSRHPTRGVLSWALASDSQTKGAEMFH